MQPIGARIGTIHLLFHRKTMAEVMWMVILNLIKGSMAEEELLMVMVAEVLDKPLVLPMNQGVLAMKAI